MVSDGYRSNTFADGRVPGNTAVVDANSANLAREVGKESPQSIPSGNFLALRIKGFTTI
jgi:hypothetical protein